MSGPARQARELQGLPVLVGVADRVGQYPPQVRGPARDGTLVEFVEVEQYAASENPSRRQVQTPHHAARDVTLSAVLQPALFYLTCTFGDRDHDIVAELRRGKGDDELGRARVLT